MGLVIMPHCVYMCTLQLLGLVSACILMRKRRAEDFIYRDLADTEGMQI